MKIIKNYITTVVVASMPLLTLATGAVAQSQTVNFGLCNSWPGHAFPVLAQEVGLTEGVGIELNITNFEDPIAAHTALAAGQIDVLECTSEYTPIAIAAGANTRLVSFVQPAYGVDHIVLAPGFDEENLEGVRIAVPEAFIGQLMVGVWLKDLGVPLDAVTYVNLLPDQAVGPMLSGALDAAYLYEPWVGQLLEELPGARSVAQGTTPAFLETGIFMEVVFMNGDFIDENREAAMAFMRARFDTVEWWNENTNEGNEFFASFLGWGKADIDGIIGTNGKFVEGGIYVYDFDEAARACGVLEGDPPFGLPNGAMLDTVTLINELWIEFGLMDSMQDASAGVDCSILGDLVASGYRQSSTARE